MTPEPTIREFGAEKDHAMVSAWWEAHGWPAINAKMLPKLGVITTIGERDTAAAWLYMDNSTPVCWLEWLVTNPDSTGRESLKSIKAITEFLQARGKEFGYVIMMTTCRQPSLVKLYESSGFIKTDEGVTHLLASL